MRLLNLKQLFWITLGTEAVLASARIPPCPRTPVSELLWGRELNLQFIETTVMWVVLSTHSCHVVKSYPSGSQSVVPRKHRHRIAWRRVRDSHSGAPCGTEWELLGGPVLSGTGTDAASGKCGPSDVSLSPAPTAGSVHGSVAHLPQEAEPRGHPWAEGCHPCALCQRGCGQEGARPTALLVPALVAGPAVGCRGRPCPRTAGP